MSGRLLITDKLQARLEPRGTRSDGLMSGGERRTPPAHSSIEWMGRGSLVVPHTHSPFPPIPSAQNRQAGTQAPNHPTSQPSKKMATVPVATHVEESTVLAVPETDAWNAIKDLRFEWWPAVQSATAGTASQQGQQQEGQEEGITVGSTRALHFKDGVQWTLQVGEEGLAGWLGRSHVAAPRTAHLRREQGRRPGLGLCLVDSGRTNRQSPFLLPTPPPTHTQPGDGGVPHPLLHLLRGRLVAQCAVGLDRNGNECEHATAW
jgi:hypothetical protein